jgi:hypothetical protein
VNKTTITRRLHIPEFQFRYWHGNPGICELHIYKLPDGKAVVIATDHCEQHHCASVTNAAEYIFAQATLEYGLTLNSTRYFEHYPDGRAELDEVLPDFTGLAGPIANARPHHGDSQLLNIAWKPGTRAEVEALIGERLEDSPHA